MRHLSSTETLDSGRVVFNALNTCSPTCLRSFVGVHVLQCWRSPPFVSCLLSWALRVLLLVLCGVDFCDNTPLLVASYPAHAFRAVRTGFCQSQQSVHKPHFCRDSFFVVTLGIPAWYSANCQSSCECQTSSVKGMGPVVNWQQKSRRFSGLFFSAGSVKRNLSLIQDFRFVGLLVNAASISFDLVFSFRPLPFSVIARLVLFLPRVRGGFSVLLRFSGC